MIQSKPPLQQALFDYVQSILPERDEQTRKDLVEVTAAVASAGFWHQQDEWRISTWFDTRIEKEQIGDREWFKVTVECDMQEFSCRCPNLEKAYLLSRFYRHLIVNQFYSVGPPWA